jgi:hypothetical protein
LGNQDLWGGEKESTFDGGGLRQAHTIEKVENPSSRLLNYVFMVPCLLFDFTACCIFVKKIG